MKQLIAVVATVLLLAGEAVAADTTATGYGQGFAASDAQSGVAVVNQTFEGTKVPKQHPQPLTAPVSVPQMFGVQMHQYGLPAELIGAALDEIYMTLCNPQAGDPCHPLPAHGHAPAIAFDARQSDVCVYGDLSAPMDTKFPGPAVAFDLRNGVEVFKMADGLWHVSRYGHKYPAHATKKSALIKARELANENGR